MPSADIERDLKWYNERAGFKQDFVHNGYAGMSLENIRLHLQWHSGSKDDPLMGGSVVKIFVDKVEPIFDDLVQKGTVNPDQLRKYTTWGTHEFGFYDLNKNAIFFVENVLP